MFESQAVREKSPCLDGVISPEEHVQQKPLHAAGFVLQGFIGGDKEALLLSSIIYVVDCITFSDATQMWGSCWWKKKGRCIEFMDFLHVGNKY